MLKKKTNTYYTPSMQKRSAIYTFKEWVPFFSQVFAVICTVAAAGIAYTLRPVYEDLRSLTKQVQALEESGEQQKQLVPVIVRTEHQVTEQDKRLERIENKLDRVIENL